MVIGADLDTLKISELSTAIAENLTRIKSEVQDAKKELIKDFPMDLAVPFVFMFYATQFAQDIQFVGKHIQLDFSLDHLNLLKPKQQKLLKNIVSMFDKETNKDGDEMIGQFYIDDNAFNSFASVATTIDKMFSARDLMKRYPNS